MRKLSQRGCWSSCDKGNAQDTGKLFSHSHIHPQSMLLESEGFCGGGAGEGSRRGIGDSANIPTVFVSKIGKTEQNTVSETRASQNTLLQPCLGFTWQKSLPICQKKQKRFEIELNKFNTYKKGKRCAIICFLCYYLFMLYILGFPLYLKYTFFICIKTKCSCKIIKELIKDKNSEICLLRVLVPSLILNLFHTLLVKCLR